MINPTIDIWAAASSIDVGPRGKTYRNSPVEYAMVIPSMLLAVPVDSWWKERIDYSNQSIEDWGPGKPTCAAGYWIVRSTWKRSLRQFYVRRKGQLVVRMGESTRLSQCLSMSQSQSLVSMGFSPPIAIAVIAYMTMCFTRFLCSGLLTRYP